MEAMSGEPRLPGQAMTQPAEPFRYDVFISYTHVEVRDATIARALKHGLERLAKPWYRRRALRVFLDESGVGAAGLRSTIVAAMQASRSCILVASPTAARRPWVNDEMRLWRECGNRRPPSLLLVDGETAWNDAAMDFDWTRTDAVPASLRGSWSEEPFVVDIRPLTDLAVLGPREPQFALALARLAAPLHGVEPGDLIGRDVREHRLTRRIASLAAALIVTLGIAAAWWAVAERAARREAQLRLADGEVFEAGVRLAQGDPPLARQRLLAAIEGYRTLGVSELPASFGLFRLHVDTRAPLLSWQAAHGRAYAVALSADKRWAVTAGADGSVRRFFLDEPGRVELLHAPGSAAARSLALGGSSAMAAVGFRDGQVLLWRDFAASPERLWDGETVSAEAIAFAGSVLAVGRADGRIQLCDIGTGSTATTKGHTNRITSLQFSGDGGTLLSGSIDNTVAVWRVGAPAASIVSAGQVRHGGPVQAVAIRSQLPRIAIGGADGLVRLWNIETGKEDAAPVHHGDPVFGLAADAQGGFGLSADAGGAAQLWDLTNGTPVARLDGSAGGFFGAAMSSDGELAATADATGQVLLWGTRTPVRRQIGESSARPTAIGLSDEGLIGGGGDGKGWVTIWDGVNGLALRRLHAHDASVARVAVCLACNSVVSAGEDRSIARLALDSGAVLWRQSAHAAVTALIVDRRGAAIAGLADGSVLSETAAGSATIRLARQPIVALATLPDNGLVAVDRAGNVYRRGAEAAAGDGERATVTAAGVASGGTVLLGRRDGSLTVVNADGTRAEIQGRGGAIVAIMLAPDGRTALTLSQGYDLALWNLPERRAIDSLQLSVYPGFNSEVAIAAVALANPALLVVPAGAAPELLDLAMAERLSPSTGVPSEADRLALNGLWQAAAARLASSDEIDPWRLHAILAARRTNLLGVASRSPSLLRPYLELLGAARQ
jgi:WD40 repeat protein